MRPPPPPPPSSAPSQTSQSAGGHDQLLKEVLTRFLPDFVALFAPHQAAALDFSTLRLLDKEVFTDVAAGRRREVDLLAEVAARDGTPDLVLIHVEAQQRRKSGFAARMMRYGLAIHLRYPEHTLLPLALLSTRAGRGWAWARRAWRWRGSPLWSITILRSACPVFQPRSTWRARSRWRWGWPR